MTDETRKRIKKELTEIRELLDGAADIADGLVTVCNHAYEHDRRTSPALAAANACAVEISDARNAAVEREEGFDA